MHRDLKSLNLLLDNKWNVKVSDFGLTKFREDLKRNGNKDIQGSVHWTGILPFFPGPRINKRYTNHLIFSYVLSTRDSS